MEEKNSNKILHANFAEDYITTDQLIEMLGVSRQTIHNWTSSKQITYYKFGKNLRFKRSDIEAFISSRCHRAI
jgi:excisionase family DNA binding protein